MTPLNVLIEAKRKLLIGVEDEYYTYDSCFQEHISEVNEIVADLKTINAPLTLKLFEGIQALLSENGEWTLDDIDAELAELLALPTQCVRGGFYFDENGNVKNIEDINPSLKAVLTLDKYPKVTISNEDGSVVGEYCYYVDEFEVKLIQAGFTFKTYPKQKMDYFYVKSLKSNHAYADVNDTDLIEYISLLCKNACNAGTLQIAYLLNENGIGDEFDSKILVESDYGQELLQRAGVTI